MLNRFADVIARVSLAIACTLAAAIFVLINIEIFCRYILGTSTLIADEYSAYGFAILVYLGMVHAVRHDELIRIDIPGRWQTFVARPGMKLFASVATLVLNSVLLYALALTYLASARFSSRSIQASNTLLAWPQGIALAAVGLLVLVSAACVLLRMRRSR